MIFSSVDLKLEHFWWFDGVSSSISYTELIFIIWENFALTKVTYCYFKIIFSHVSEIHVRVLNIAFSFGVQDAAWLDKIFIDKADENIITF